MTISALPVIRARVQARLAASIINRRIWSSPGVVDAGYTAPDAVAASADIRPFDLSSFTAEPYTLLRGHPYVAANWVQIQTVVSSTGEYASASRRSPWDLDLSMTQARFIPSVETWDDISLVWQPASAIGTDYTWTAVSGSEPFVESITYRINKELITTDCLYFPPGAYLTSSFNSDIDDANSYAVIMVLSLEHPAPYTIFAGASGDPNLNVSFLGEQISAEVADGTVKVSPRIHPVQTIPLYLVLSVFPGRVSLWLGNSPQRMSTGTTATTQNSPSKMKFQIGRSQTGSATGTFRLLDFSLWPYSFSGQENPEVSVYTALEALSSVYGAI